MRIVGWDKNHQARSSELVEKLDTQPRPRLQIDQHDLIICELLPMFEFRLDNSSTELSSLT